VKPSQALEANRDAVRSIVGRFSASNPRIFGSASLGTDHDGSDLDILVDALPGATLFDLGGLQEELQDLLGVRVDLLTPGDLPIKFRAQVIAQARSV
jgi:uncharacterized protein